MIREKIAVDIVALPEVVAIGLKIDTHFEQAAKDCPALWQAFMPRMHEVNGKRPEDFHGESYGISTDMQEHGAFTYWAAVPGDPDNIPAGMQAVRLPQGVYARCYVASLEKIGEIYTFLYQRWDAARAGYAVNYAAPCFERYDETYLTDGSFAIYVPVNKQ
ncbi:MAG: GyrI-like domain-containing protein [Desulfobulbus sp.]|jgi:predicted transcriptional regulator YdeE|uniref:GyrI-like domain-containing protein n=1 Tax=Desulfobulbus sp. TaxID=895 RepID=UPI00283BC60F|nr:GyrI-like domain-containing protein [Desulfobulbus sp.]MDR2550264.1 GyrI-like domain-containing protein [Desulfobulbus sp.]